VESFKDAEVEFAKQKAKESKVWASMEDEEEKKAPEERFLRRSR
jgi:hypothetical protein